MEKKMVKKFHIMIMDRKNLKPNCLMENPTDYELNGMKMGIKKKKEILLMEIKTVNGPTITKTVQSMVLKNIETIIL